jgi:hypothetical protein
MRAGILGAPRPEPSRAVPILAGGLVVAVALPVFLAAGWRLAGWGIAAALWAGVQLLGLLMTRFRPGRANLAASGVLAFGMLFRVVAVMVVLVAVASSNARVALAAAAVYALAYTAELGLSVAGYYGQEPTL